MFQNNQYTTAVLRFILEHSVKINVPVNLERKKTKSVTSLSVHHQPAIQEPCETRLGLHTPVRFVRLEPEPISNFFANGEQLGGPFNLWVGG